MFAAPGGLFQRLPGDSIAVAPQRMLDTTHNPQVATVAAAGLTTAGNLWAWFQDTFAGITVTSLTGVGGAAIGLYILWRDQTRRANEKDAETRRLQSVKDAEADARKEEIQAASLNRKLDAMRETLAHLEQRVEDANHKLHKADNQRNELSLQLQAANIHLARAEAENRMMRRQLGMPDIDPDTPSDEIPTILDAIKPAAKEGAKEAIAEAKTASDYELTAHEPPTPDPEAPSDGGER